MRALRETWHICNRLRGSKEREEGEKKEGWSEEDTRL